MVEWRRALRVESVIWNVKLDWMHVCCTRWAGSRANWLRYSVRRHSTSTSQPTTEDRAAPWLLLLTAENSRRHCRGWIVTLYESASWWNSHYPCCGYMMLVSVCRLCKIAWWLIDIPVIIVMIVAPLVSKAICSLTALLHAVIRCHCTEWLYDHDHVCLNCVACCSLFTL